MHRLLKLGTILTTIALVLPFALLSNPEKASAAATMYITAPATGYIGQDISFTVNVNTGGDSANAFDATFSYSTAFFDGVRGTYAGSICTLPITSAEPSGGSATISCGKPSGYTGTGLVATIVLRAKQAGTTNLTLSNCQVLKNDGLGTNITGGCSDDSITLSAAPTPSSGGGGGTPTPSSSGTPFVGATGTALPKNTATPKPGSTPKPTASVTPGGPAVGADAPEAAEPTPSIEAPAAAELPDPTPTPEETDTPQSERRSIGQALRDILTSFGELRSASGNLTGIIALMITLIPFLLILLAIVFLGYRLYLLERRRRRTLDRLFELELAELASLEGKLDLLAEKGTKGRQQFREEFQAVKENILRQIKPDYNRPVDKPKEKPAEPEQK